MLLNKEQIEKAKKAAAAIRKVKKIWAREEERKQVTRKREIKRKLVPVRRWAKRKMKVPGLPKGIARALKKRATFKLSEL